MKIFILFAVLILAVSCAKDNPLNSSNNNNNQTIANYEGTYEGKAKYTTIPYSGQATEENVSLIVINKDSTVTFKTTSKEFPFNSVSKEDDKNYNSTKTEDGSTLIFSLIFDGNGNVNFSLIIQDNNTGTSEIYSSDKLTKTAS